ncbi:MAG TPA: fatty acid desaturase [Polyangiales bacterium]|nr:fatty acid desaturase [Polyangiales bacterium]
MPSPSSRALEDTLAKADYEVIRAQLVFRPSPLLGTLTLVVNAALFAVVLALLATESRSAYWGAQLLIPIVMFQAFGVLHDCGHGSFSASRLVNTLVGHYASVLCCLPFLPWKYVHTDHHVWAGNPERDPGLAIVRRAREGKLPWIMTTAWRSWLPLAGFAQHVVFWTYPIVQARQGKLSRSRLIRCAGSVAWLAFALAGLHWLAPSLITFRNFLPGIAVYLVAVELVNLPHHTGLTAFDQRLPLWQQHLPTRSCNYPPIVSELLVLNFNFHIEHHLFPNLPWYRLRTARRLVNPALAHLYREAHGFNWAIRARKKNLVDVLAKNSADFESVRPMTVDHGREVPT